MDHAAPAWFRVLLVLFRGLEGSSSSHDTQAFADLARTGGFGFAVAHWRGCSGELRRGPRAYHSGDLEDMGWIPARFRQPHRGALLAVAAWLAAPIRTP